ncbi:MAG: hypothetical protein IPG08_03410 [Sphingobacteriaceae bacterium]|nr:hypothetical protein [Sphingobacteriaceae bacterium]
MNSNFLRTVGAGLAVAVILSGCDGLGKMLKKQKDIQYTLTPSPIEMIGDSVQFSVNGKFNPKLFAKKVTLTITPVVKYATGEKALKPLVLVGEKATGSGQKLAIQLVELLPTLLKNSVSKQECVMLLLNFVL